MSATEIMAELPKLSPRERRRILVNEWRELRQTELLEDWELARQNKILKPIPPWTES